MNNKKRLTILVITILVFAAIVAYWLLQKSSQSEVVAESTTQTFAIDSSVLSKNSHSPPPKFVPKTPKQKRWLEMGTQMDLQEVNFYGRVVDQNNQSVVGAIVPYELAGSALGGSNGAGQRITDANGEFKIEGRKGSGLLLKTISHPEIEFGYSIPDSTATTWDNSNVKTMAVYGFQPSEGANEVLWSDTSPEKPYIFKAWRINGYVVQDSSHAVLGEGGGNSAMIKHTL